MIIKHVWVEFSPRYWALPLAVAAPEGCSRAWVVQALCVEITLFIHRRGE